MKKRFLAILSVMACMSFCFSPVTGMVVSAETADTAAASADDAVTTSEDDEATPVSEEDEATPVSEEGEAESGETDEVSDYYSFYTDPWIDAWFSGDKSSLEGVDEQYGVTDSYTVDEDNYKSLVEEVGERVKDVKSTGTMNDDQTVVTIKREVECKNKKVDFTFTFNNKEQTFEWTVDAEATMGETVAKAGLNTLMGMGTVFIVLIFISFVISLFKFLSEKDNKKAKPAPEAAPASAPAPAAPVVATPSVSADSTMSDDELIAVISAAIAAYEDDVAGSNVPADGLIVRSIKKRGFN